MPPESDPADPTNDEWEPRLGPFDWERDRVLYKYGRRGEPDTYEIQDAERPDACIEATTALNLADMV